MFAIYSTSLSVTVLAENKSCYIELVTSSICMITDTINIITYKLKGTSPYLKSLRISTTNSHLLWILSILHLYQSAKMKWRLDPNLWYIIKIGGWLYEALIKWKCKSVTVNRLLWVLWLLLVLDNKILTKQYYE